MSTSITDRSIAREAIVVADATKTKRNPRTQHWVWHDGFAHAVFHGVDAYAQAVAYKREKKGKGTISRITRTSNIPPAALVATWEAEGHKQGSKADVAAKFGFGVFDPAKLKDYAAACYDAVNKALRKQGNKPFVGMAKLIDGGKVKGLQVTGDLSVDTLNDELGDELGEEEEEEELTPEAAELLAELRAEADATDEANA